VVVLERIDEAHPDVRALVRRAIEKGTLTDTAGRLVSFGGAFVVMTVTTDGEARRPIGFGGRADDDAAAAVPKDVSDLVDAVVELRALDRATMAGLVAARLGDLVSRVAAKGRRATVGEGVAEAVADMVAERGEGARFVRRVLRDTVEDAVVKALAGGTMDEIRIIRSDGEVTVVVGCPAVVPAAPARSAA
jgi:ATP-dependent Clp protease ATP-binding subunit ClpC